MGKARLSTCLLVTTSPSCLLSVSNGWTVGIKSCCFMAGRLAADFLSFLACCTQVHRLKSASVTVLLKEKYIEEDKKGWKARSSAVADEEDIDVIGLAEEDWLVLKVPALDIEESFYIQKALLWQHKKLHITTGLHDTGVCILSKDVMDVLEEERGITAIESELIPLLVRRQFLCEARKDFVKSQSLSITCGTRNSLSDKDCKELIANLNPISAYEEQNKLSRASHNVCH